LLKLPELVGHHGDGVRGQAIVGALCAGAAAWFAIKFLMRYFETNTLTPFAVYCLLAGLGSLLVFVF
jgi:undecaprenyl-diphosphatase